MRSDYLSREEYMHLLAALTLPNRLALEVSLATGLRISDVLNMRSIKLAQRMTIRELKTGKNRRVRIPTGLLDALLAQAGKIFVFESRTDHQKPRTRQAVYKDLKRAAKLFRISKALQISPHTARKVYAVSQYQTGGSLKKVQDLLQHSSEAVTVLYAMADEITERKITALKKKVPKNCRTDA